jgi:hypothetical protein
MLFTRKSDPEATFNFTFNETIKQKMVERFVDGTTANKIITYKIAVKTANVENAGILEAKIDNITFLRFMIVLE